MKKESVRRAGKNLQKCRLFFFSISRGKSLKYILLLIIYRWMNFKIQFLGLLGNDMIPIVICFKYCYSLKVIAVIAIAFLLIQNAFIAFISLNVNRSL